MGLYKYVRELWKQPQNSLGDLWKQRLIEWRREEATTRLERPTRIDRARSLGYKAKQGFIVVRQRVPKGGHWRPQPFSKGGRRPKTNRQRMSLRKNYQQIAEERANKKYINCEVLNSYWVAEDGKFRWFEIIFIDRAHPQILADPHLASLVSNRGKSFRGLTSAGRKSRGLLYKGKGVEKMRPSRRANDRLA